MPDHGRENTVITIFACGIFSCCVISIFCISCNKKCQNNQDQPVNVHSDDIVHVESSKGLGLALPLNLDLENIPSNT